MFASPIPSSPGTPAIIQYVDTLKLEYIKFSEILDKLNTHSYPILKDHDIAWQCYNKLDKFTQQVDEKEYKELRDALQTLALNFLLKSIICRPESRTQFAFSMRRYISAAQLCAKVSEIRATEQDNDQFTLACEINLSEERLSAHTHFIAPADVDKYFEESVHNFVLHLVYRCPVLENDVAEIQKMCTAAKEKDAWVLKLVTESHDAYEALAKVRQVKESTPESLQELQELKTRFSDLALVGLKIPQSVFPEIDALTAQASQKNT
jgi:hypothetical protein